MGKNPVSIEVDHQRENAAPRDAGRADFEDVPEWMGQSEASTSGQGTQVYQRRRRMVATQAEKSREGLRPKIQLAAGPAAGVRVSRPSWVHRALSARRHSIMLEQPILPSSESESESSDEDSEDDDASAPPTPDPAERPLVLRTMYKPLPSLPQDFVQERLAYFAGVEAYELEEESPQPDADQRSPRFVTEADEEDFSVEHPEFEAQRRWRPLEAVAEEDVADEDLREGEAGEHRESPELAEAGAGDGASALREERDLEGAPESVASITDQENLSSREENVRGASIANATGLGLEPILEISEASAGEGNDLQEGALLDAKAAAVSDGKATTKTDGAADRSVRRLVFDEVPPNVPRSRRTSPSELARARGKKLAPAADQTVADVSSVAVADVSRGLGQLSLDAAPVNDDVFGGRDVRRSVNGARRLSRRRSSLAKPGKVAREPETPLQAILRACGQDTMLGLNEYISRFYPVDKLSKLGEGTFGEALRAGDMCFKIVPMGCDVKVNGEAQKTVEEMYSEVLLTNAITSIRFGSDTDALPDNASDNFIQTFGVGICRGAYSEELTAAWEAWDQENGSENDHPRIFQEDQVYVVFAFADGGSDLEHFTLRTYAEAVSLLLQVVASLAVAEQACKFEHRDMHWGNILLARRGQAEARFRLDGSELRARSCGVSVALIDFTLSRLNAGPRVLFCDLTADTWLFEGPKGDVQADTYRRMKKATKGCWEGSFPETNVYWIHYLVDILLNKKAFACSPAEKHSLRGFRKRSLTYRCAKNVLQDELFAESWI
ncbi:haspin family Serine/threonine kinase [Klebsormidium nitens]|uniref:non-specific serine/threonine protein kinase n=1 Tax=Klebsormidium nitens TaxID=105231 RepID=A0A1Y1HXA7_KLENI|nr:haspin family Serine/threonine kinase [Klebsormidium nitens]|eukprot:GAQ81799.1 haspin family Serine/threonine kinase [Klebsormidium nitens]